MFDAKRRLTEPFYGSRCKGIRVRIVFDEEKIEQEQKWDLDKMYAIVDAAFLKYNFRKEGHVYVGPGTDKDFAYAGIVCMTCGRTDWFLDNVLEWRWYHGEDEENLLKETEYYRGGFRD